MQLGVKRVVCLDTPHTLPDYYLQHNNTVSAPTDQGRSAGYSREDDLPRAPRPFRASYTNGQVYLSGQHKETQNIHPQPLRGRNQALHDPWVHSSQRQDVQVHAHEMGQQSHRPASVHGYHTTSQLPHGMGQQSHRPASGQVYHTTSHLPYGQSQNFTPQYSELGREQHLPAADGREQNTFPFNQQPSSQVPRAGRGRHACVMIKYKTHILREE